YTAQRYDYSGKRRYHVVKNSLICDEFQFIHFVGYTWRGAINDPAMISEEIPHLNYPCFDQLWLSKDSGYQGYQPTGVHLLEQFKAFRNTPLTQIQKDMNTWISSIRVVIENAISGIKRLRAAKEQIRKLSIKKADQIITLAAALHNLRVRLRKDTYNLASSCVRANLTPFGT
ncbi:MAG: transposase family protein, partial [Bacteroidota bacterium]